MMALEDARMPVTVTTGDSGTRGLGGSGTHRLGGSGARGLARPHPVSQGSGPCHQPGTTGLCAATSLGLSPPGDGRGPCWVRLPHAPRSRPARPGGSGTMSVSLPFPCRFPAALLLPY